MHWDIAEEEYLRKLENTCEEQSRYICKSGPQDHKKETMKKSL